MIGKLCIVRIGYFKAMSKVVHCHNSKEYVEANALSSLFCCFCQENLIKRRKISSFSETHSTLTMVGPYFDLGSK